MLWVVYSENTPWHTKCLNTHTPTQNAIPNAVVLSLQVVVDTVNQVTEEASIDGLRKLVSVLL